MNTFERTIELASSRTLKALQMTDTAHEFPFKLPLATKMPASFTGPNHKYHTYDVQVILSHRFKSDIVVSKSIRIYHLPPFGLESLDPSQPMV